MLKHSDNLSKTLQSPSLTAAEAHTIANLTCQTIERIRTDACFDLFWEKTLSLQSSLGIDEPELPRRRKRLRRYDPGLSEGDFQESQYFKVQYYEVIVNLIALIHQH